MAHRHCIAALACSVGLALAGCGGASGVPSSSPPPASSRQDAARVALVRYLARVHPALAAVEIGVGRASAAMTLAARDPGRRSGATAAARAAAQAAATAGSALRDAAPPTLRPAQRALRGSLGHLAVGLRRVGVALADGAPQAMRAARPPLERSAQRALAWEGLLRRECREAGRAAPAWIARPAGWAPRVLAAARSIRPELREPGATGVDVAALQRRLAALRYLPAGYATAVYDDRTRQAVVAFQGWTGLARDGIAGPQTWGALPNATRPAPWHAEGRHLELHKAQQVLLLVDGGAVLRAIHVSTAAPGHVTPDGTFTIYRKERMSWSVPFQVWMPYASYFTGGYALHEYPDVPPYPASHGCVRVPAGEAVVVWDFASLGTPLEIG